MMLAAVAIYAIGVYYLIDGIHRNANVYAIAHGFTLG